MLYFDSADLYVQSQDDINAKIAAIQAIQDALLTTALTAAAKGDISEYMLNDGQTVIKTTYRNAEEIMKSHDAFEKIKQRYINNLNGRRVRLVDSKNFNNYGSSR